MSYRLEYHDLIKVPLSKPGIYWLRLYRESSGSSVAIVTEVPGNPGKSVTNAISEVADYITVSFRVDSERLKLYQIWPRRAGARGGAEYRRVMLSGAHPEWSSVASQEVEDLVGGRLPTLPRHEALYSRVLSLGGGNSQEIYRWVFEAIPVGRLPPPHNPSNCVHFGRFKTLLDGGMAPTVAGQVFIATLTPADLAACRHYHRANWHAIADASVSILQRLGPAEGPAYVKEARGAGLPTRDREFLASLFADPVVVSEGGYSNGQHRGCALRFSGAEKAAVATDDECVGTVCVDWIYAGDG